MGTARGRGRRCWRCHGRGKRANWIDGGFVSIAGRVPMSVRLHAMMITEKKGEANGELGVGLPYCKNETHLGGGGTWPKGDGGRWSSGLGDGRVPPEGGGGDIGGLSTGSGELTGLTGSPLNCHRGFLNGKGFFPLRSGTKRREGYVNDEGYREFLYHESKAYLWGGGTRLG